MIKKENKKNKKAQENLIPLLHESVISRINSDKTVSIVNLELDDTCFSLDGIAADAWILIDGENSLDNIKNRLIKKHRPPLEKFNQDFDKLIKKLKKENLILLN
jgi:hypothetical protein